MLILDEADEMLNKGLFNNCFHFSQILSLYSPIDKLL